MSTKNNESEGGAHSSPESERGKLFKSSEVAVQRLNAATNSAVSDVAVSRGIEEVPTGEWVDEALPSASQPFAQPEVDPSAAPPVPTPGDAEQMLEASLAKVEETVQSIEQRRAQIEETYQKAEAMLAEAQRISASLQVGDALRQRIEATIARTRGLRKKQQQ
jgi:hypothetical protein